MGSTLKRLEDWLRGGQNQVGWIYFGMKYCTVRIQDAGYKNWEVKADSLEDAINLALDKAEGKA